MASLLVVQIYGKQRIRFSQIVRTVPQLDEDPDVAADWDGKSRQSDE